jgi:hypothetical protein
MARDAAPISREMELASVARSSAMAALHDRHAQD